VCRESAGGCVHGCRGRREDQHPVLHQGRADPKKRCYDLTGVKVLKKTPLLVKHFDDFFRLLPDRADSEWSWTVDLDERKQTAAEEARPFKEQATKKRQQAEQWKERIRVLKKAKPQDQEALGGAESQAQGSSKEAREAAGKAREIEDAVYDLKAVNPHKKADIDTRTPEELLDIIEAKGREIAEAIALLRGGCQYNNN
jgi:type I restriction enzyme M protein